MLCKENRLHASVVTSCAGLPGRKNAASWQERKKKRKKKKLATAIVDTAETDCEDMAGMVGSCAAANPSERAAAVSQLVPKTPHIAVPFSWNCHADAQVPSLASGALPEASVAKIRFVRVKPNQPTSSRQSVGEGILTPLRTAAVPAVALGGLLAGAAMPARRFAASAAKSKKPRCGGQLKFARDPWALTWPWIPQGPLPKMGECCRWDQRSTSRGPAS